MNQQKLFKAKYLKTLSWLAIGGALLGVVQIVWSMVITKQFEHVSYYIIMGINYLGFKGGKKLLRKEYAGLKLLAIFFGLQVVAVTTPYLHLNFIYGISLNLHLKIQQYAFSINFYALVLFLLSLELIWEQKQLSIIASSSATKVEPL
jgi:hypothetical protein